MLCAAASPLNAGGTPAGTSIDNVATATWDGPGGTQAVTSNVVRLRVDELLGVVVASGEAGPVAANNGDMSRPHRFQITNAGNGPETFALSSMSAIGGDDFDPALVSIVIDANGNGAYDPGVDTVHAPGANGPILQPDQSLSVFILANMPGTAANGARGTIRLTATAMTGTGPAGTTFAGAGQGGGDAVVGTTTARAQGDGLYALASVGVTFVKSAVVADPFGGTRAVPGSIISYALRADLAGSGTLTNLRLTDTIPAGTTYQPGSITLDGAAFTDASDGDAGAFANNAIAVVLPTAAAGASHVITFKVRID